VLRLRLLLLLLLHVTLPSVESPAQQVIDLHNGISVRKRQSGRQTIYALSGLPLRRSKPIMEKWWLRGDQHVTNMC
jgi:hypothetical protein